MNKLLTLSLLVGLVACGGEEPAETPKPATPEGGPSLASFRLAEAPDGSVSVLDAKGTEPKEEVVVEGRVSRIVRGFASFQLMDTTLDYCGEVNKADKCPTPWDYCCDTPDDRQRHALVVNFVGENGKVLRVADQEELRLLDKVVVQGRVEKDEHGNVSIVATGWHRVERPALPDYVRFPGE